MRRYFYSVLALMVLVAAVGAACDGSEPSAPEATATPTSVETPAATGAPTPGTTPTEPPAPDANDADTPTPTSAQAPAATPTATAAPTPTSAQAPAATPTATAAPTPTSAQAPADTAPADPQAAIYEALLATIPDTPETRNEVYIGDYALARQVFDAATFPLPGPGDDEDAVVAFMSLEWLPPLGTETQNVDYPWILGTPGFLDQVIYGDSSYMKLIAGNLQYLAFDVRSIDQSILAGRPNQYQALRGRFDPQAADAALSACSECTTPSREEHRGIPYYSWGEDNAVNSEKIFAPPAFDQLGRGGRIAVLDKYVFRTLGTSEMKALIDAHLNEGPSLADVEEFRLLAGGMSQLRAYSMFLSGKVELWGLPNNAKALAGQDASQADIEAKERELAEAGPWLRPYQAFASGIGKDAEGPYMALALAHADAASAEENVGLLRRIIEEGSSTFYGNPWSDTIDVGSLEIKSEGRLLLAKLRGDIAASGGWLNWVFYVDSLILHE